MATLTIHLQDGFLGDTVVVSLDGEEIARREGVTTDLRLSRAAVIETEVADGDGTITVALPERGLAAELALPLAGEVVLAANVREGRLELDAPEEQPYYL
jgi:hypothetical protein